MGRKLINVSKRPQKIPSLIPALLLNSALNICLLKIANFTSWFVALHVLVSTDFTACTKFEKKDNILFDGKQVKYYKDNKQ